MISINTKILILRPIWEVFNYITRPENNEQWQYGSLASVRISKGNIKLGTLFSSFGHFMGRRIQGDFEVSKFEVNKKYSFKTFSGPIQLRTSYTFETVGSGTNLAVSTQINPGAFFKLVDPIVAKVAKKQFTENLATLKQILEATEIKHEQKQPSPLQSRP